MNLGPIQLLVNLLAFVWSLGRLTFAVPDIRKREGKESISLGSVCKARALRRNTLRNETIAVDMPVNTQMASGFLSFSEEYSIYT